MYYIDTLILVIVPIALAFGLAMILTQIRPIRKAVTEWIER